MWTAWHTSILTLDPRERRKVSCRGFVCSPPSSRLSVSGRPSLKSLYVYTCVDMYVPQNFLYIYSYKFKHVYTQKSFLMHNIKVYNI